MIDAENAEKIEKEKDSMSMEEIRLTVSFLEFTVKQRASARPVQEMIEYAGKLIKIGDADLSVSQRMCVSAILDIATKHKVLLEKTSAFALLLQHLRLADKHNDVDEMFDAMMVLEKEGRE